MDLFDKFRWCLGFSIAAMVLSIIILLIGLVSGMGLLFAVAMIIVSGVFIGLTIVFRDKLLFFDEVEEEVLI